MGEIGREEIGDLGFKHLVIVKFKEDVNVEEILNGLHKLVLDIDLVKSFEWGEDKESQEMLRKGLTHSFIMTFEKKEHYIEFVKHPSHVQFSSIFSTAIDDIVLLDFAFAVVKPPPTAVSTTLIAAPAFVTVVPPTATAVPTIATAAPVIMTAVPPTATAAPVIATAAPAIAIAVSATATAVPAATTAVPAITTAVATTVTTVPSTAAAAVVPTVVAAAAEPAVPTVKAVGDDGGDKDENN